MNAHFPERPWQGSPAFAQWLDSLPKTPAYERRLAAERRAEEARIKAEQAKAERQREERREVCAIDRAERRAVRGWGGGKKPKHVVLGRVHVMEDDDNKGRSGYNMMNRFAFR